jgi:hypothetical protein
MVAAQIDRIIKGIPDDAEVIKVDFNTRRSAS